jgi:hypothetical protein
MGVEAKRKPAGPEGLVKALRDLYTVAKRAFEMYGFDTIRDTYINATMGIPMVCIEVRRSLDAIAVDIYYDCRLTDPPLFSATVSGDSVKVFTMMPGATFAIDYVREYIEGLVNAKEVDGDE